MGPLSSEGTRFLALASSVIMTPPRICPLKESGQIRKVGVRAGIVPHCPGECKKA